MFAVLVESAMVEHEVGEEGMAFLLGEASAQLVVAGKQREVWAHKAVGIQWEVWGHGEGKQEAWVLLEV